MHSSTLIFDWRSSNFLLLHSSLRSNKFRQEDPNEEGSDGTYGHMAEIAGPGGGDPVTYYEDDDSCW